MDYLPNSSPKPKPYETLDQLKDILTYHPNVPGHFRDNYKDKPITLLRTFYPKLKWPRKFREIFAQIWLGKAGKKIIITGPRGGGKSVLLGAIGFCLWFLRNKSVVDMGGSLAQAKLVYSYFTSIVYSNPQMLAHCEKEPLMEKTVAKGGNYFSAVPASPKAVRGPHPDVLMADEVCEAKDEILADALPMVSSSQDPLTILTSTFHKVFGAFQEIWDGADEFGYTRFTWDIFDVTQSFDPKIWNDPELNRVCSDLGKLKELAKGRTGDPEGWVQIENIIDAWRGKRSLDWFLTEYMGLRPSAVGLVNDPVDVEAAMLDATKEIEYHYVSGAECIIGIDWGFSSMTAVVDFMLHKDAVKVQIDNKTYTQTASDVIIDDVVQMVRTRGHRFIYADSAGKFENDALQNRLNKERLKCKVIEVVFSKDKDEMVGNYRAHFQRQIIKIPERFKEAKWQHKRYRYQEGSNRPMKKDDHVPDATMCALKHWPMGIERSHIADMPKVDETKSATISRGLLHKEF